MIRQQAVAAWKAAVAHADAVSRRNQEQPLQNHSSAREVAEWNMRHREWEEAVSAADRACSAVWDAA